MATVSDSELEIFGLDGADAAGGDCEPAGSSEPVVEGALALQADPAAPGNPITREQRRSRRKREIRARTISVKRMTKRELEIGRMLYPETDYYKPGTRAECVDGPRPCPYVSCQHHLYLDVSARTGAIKLNFPDLEVWDMNETCALDVADRGGTTLEDVGAIMNLTRERIRQVEVKALAKLEALKDMSALREFVDEGPVGKRRLPVLTQPEEDEDEDEDEVALDEDEDEGEGEGDAEDESLEATPPERTAELEDAGDFDSGE
ncbi:sigma factor-like helix-turn-helix DNA-binding protein [Sorangium sp. So ce590]|uniref:sigma factor-like helix-turn-helix DNA-binding protein n=1 Tax=Sorangium sp. So ce590 TaxID=3133317 RepID=UPI003F5E6996